MQYFSFLSEFWLSKICQLRGTGVIISHSLTSLVIVKAFAGCRRPEAFVSCLPAST